MNLREDIERIKEVMGINESRDMFFKRRRKEFIDTILHSFEWIEREEADSFEEYLQYVLMHAIDGFFDYNNILIKHDEMEELLPMALQILQNEEWLFRKIKDYYYSNESDTTITEHLDNTKKLDNSIYDKIEIKKSKIDGLGVFAEEDIKKNTIYLYAIIKDGSYFGGELIRYLNHSYDPNIKNTKIGDKIYGKTIKDIKKGDELTSNYDNNDYTLSYDEMLNVNYHDLLDVKKIKCNIPFFKYKITPKLFF